MSTRTTVICAPNREIGRHEAAKYGLVSVVIVTPHQINNARGVTADRVVILPGISHAMMPIILDNVLPSLATGSPGASR